MKKLFIYIMAFLAGGALTTCKDMDDTYKEFIVPSGRTYPQKVDSLLSYPGFNRLRLRWLKVNDPRVSYARVYWNNYQDSLNVSIPPSERYVSVDISELEEKTYTLYVKTFDDDGNASIPSVVTGSPYGSNYIVGQVGRNVESAVKTGDNGVITWAAAAKNLVYTEVRYTASSGQKEIVRVPNSETQTICPNIKLYELFEYRSAFLPEGGLDIVENDWRYNAKPFGYQPAAAFISGEGSEGGADISKASRMKQTATGEFEVYTYLLAGKPFYFTDGNTGSYRKFYTTGDNLLKEDGSTTVSTEGIYRITLNFNAGTSTYTLVTRLGFFFSPSNAVLFDLDYMGNGVFQKRATVTFKQESWGRDERYKFRMFVRENGGADAERQLEWATLNTTDSRPTATSPESYYYMRLIDLLTQWDNKWKLMADFDGVEATYTVYLNTDKANYTHTIQK